MVVSKTEKYCEVLRSLDDWEPFLLAESGLPGRRANIELARAVAVVGDRRLFNQFLSNTPEKAPTNHPAEFLAFCGVLGLGRLLAEGDRTLLRKLRRLASDPRWRIREAVAMALQRFGEVDFLALAAEMHQWATGSLLEQRAAAAALCEPDLLIEHEAALGVFDVLDRITASVIEVVDRRSDDFFALRKGLAYCWSVAVAAVPQPGKERMARWFEHQDPAIRWIMKQNLKKKRLARLDPAWTARWLERMT